MEKNFCVYILASGRNGTLYTGITSDLIKRVWQHKNNEVEGFTEKYEVHDLVWFEQHDSVEIVVQGIYEYSGTDQWLRYVEEPTLPAPFWLRNTGLARHDASFDPVIEGLADRAADPTQRVAVLHDLMERISARVAYKTGVSTVDTTAVEALTRGAGVAQDEAHIFIACCRRLGVPARYVSGYLRNDDPELHVGRTSHSWAEAWVPGLEWVGFDPANGISPRGDSLRVAVGLDYRDAAPVSGRRVGFGDAKMTVDCAVRLID